MPTEAIEVTRPEYVVTIVCPICHTQINPHDGVIRCDKCGVTFRLATVPRPVGPQETKNAE